MKKIIIAITFFIGLLVSAQPCVTKPSRFDRIKLNCLDNSTSVLDSILVVTPSGDVKVMPKSALPSTGSGIQTVTGDIVDNTDPENPIVEVPSLEQINDQEPLSLYDAGTGDNFQFTASGIDFHSTSGYETSVGNFGITSSSDNYGNIVTLGGTGIVFSNSPNSTLLRAQTATLPGGEVIIKDTAGTTQTAAFLSDIPEVQAGTNISIDNTDPLNPVISSTGGGVTSITASSPLTGGTITTSGSIGIQNGAADNTTKGAVSFSSSDFDSSVGNISIDYTNGQNASGSQKGFLSSTDWSTFNNKQNDLFDSINSTILIYDELGTNGNGIYFTSNNSGGSNSPSNLSGTQGVILSTTGSGSSNSAGLVCGEPTSGSYYIGKGAWVMESYINIPTLSTSGERYNILFGLTTSSNYANTNGVFFLYDEGGVFNSGASAGSPNWKCVTKSSGGATYNVSSIAVATGFTKLRLEVNAAGTVVTAYVNGVALGSTNTTNIPNNTTAMSFRLWITKSVGTTARTLYTDYIKVKCNLTTAR